MRHVSDKVGVRWLGRWMRPDSPSSVEGRPQIGPEMGGCRKRSAVRLEMGARGWRLPRGERGAEQTLPFLKQPGRQLGCKIRACALFIDKPTTTWARGEDTDPERSPRCHGQDGEWAGGAEVGVAMEAAAQGHPHPPRHPGRPCC